MKISVITVTYNAAATIEDCLKSVISQDYPDLEYIVVDGASVDSTLDILKKYKSNISRFISEKDEGLYDALNKGIALATGEYIAILHADDFYANPWVISAYARMLKSGDCDAVYADLVYVDAKNKEQVVRKWKSGFYSQGAFLYGWMPPHPTFIVKNLLYQKLGNYNLEFKTAADYELMLRFIHKHQIRLCYLPETTVYMRRGGMSNSSLANRFKANMEDRKAWSVNGLKPRFYTLFLKPLRKIFQFF